MANGDESGAPAPGEGEGVIEDDVERRKADADFDDLIIEIDESELEAELTGQPPAKKH